MPISVPLKAYADLKARSRAGETPLGTAQRWGHQEIVDLLRSYRE